MTEVRIQSWSLGLQNLCPSFCLVPMGLSCPIAKQSFLSIRNVSRFPNVPPPSSHQHLLLSLVRKFFPYSHCPPIPEPMRPRLLLEHSQLQRVFWMRNSRGGFSQCQTSPAPLFLGTKITHHFSWPSFLEIPPPHNPRGHDCTKFPLTLVAWSLRIQSMGSRYYQLVPFSQDSTGPSPGGLRDWGWNSQILLGMCSSRESRGKWGSGDAGREKQIRDPSYSQIERACMCTKTGERNLVPKFAWGQSSGLMKSASILPTHSLHPTEVPCITCWAPLQPQGQEKRDWLISPNPPTPSRSGRLWH